MILSLRGGGGVGGTRKDALLCTRRRELASIIVWQGLFFNNIWSSEHANGQFVCTFTSSQLEWYVLPMNEHFFEHPQQLVVEYISS